MDKQIWHDGIEEELLFWDYWFRTAGLEWKDDFKFRTDPSSELQDEFKTILDGIQNPRILDIGAGPLSYLGKNINGKPLIIIAIDALAYQYDELLARHNINPVLRTIHCDSENIVNLPEHFGLFDLMVARNTLDNSYDPMFAVVQMPDRLKVGGTIYLRHYIREATRGNHNGLHQWDFFLDGSFKMKSLEEEIDVDSVIKDHWGDSVETNCFTEGNEVIYTIKKLR